jgi:hypothetical protein
LPCLISAPLSSSPFLLAASGSQLLLACKACSTTPGSSASLARNGIIWPSRRRLLLLCPTSAVPPSSRAPWRQSRRRLLPCPTPAAPPSSCAPWRQRPQDRGGSFSRALRWLRIHGPCDDDSSSLRMADSRKKGRRKKGKLVESLKFKAEITQDVKYLRLFCLNCGRYGDGGSTYLPHHTLARAKRGHSGWTEATTMASPDRTPRR